MRTSRVGQQRQQRRSAGVAIDQFAERGLAHIPVAAWRLECSGSSHLVEAERGREPARLAEQKNVGGIDVVEIVREIRFSHVHLALVLVPEICWASSLDAVNARCANDRAYRFRRIDNNWRAGRRSWSLTSDLRILGPGEDGFRVPRADG